MQKIFSPVLFRFRNNAIIFYFPGLAVFLLSLEGRAQQDVITILRPTFQLSTSYRFWVIHTYVQKCYYIFFAITIFAYYVEGSNLVRFNCSVVHINIKKFSFIQEKFGSSGLHSRPNYVKQKVETKLMR